MKNNSSITHNWILKFIIRKKGYFYRIIAFIGFFTLIVILSEILTKISFTDSIDLANPNNVAELQPLTNLDQRKMGLFSLIFTFSIVASIIGRWQGFGSILSLFLSAFTIFKLIVPLILLGWNPLFVTLVCGIIVISASIFFSHGLNYKTIIGVTGGTISILITLLISEFFRSFIQVSGYYGDATYNLLVNTQMNFDMGSIVLASIIFSGLGLLDDVTITQTSVVKELYHSNKSISMRKLYDKAMVIGRDHIGALVNSLFWAYTGASLPLLLLLNHLETNLDQIVSYEFFMEEILRTLVSSTGLILSVPITTLLAVYVFKKFKPATKEEETSHSRIQ